MLRATARLNEALAEAFFRPLPSDHVTNYDDINRRRKGLPDRPQPALDATGSDAVPRQKQPAPEDWLPPSAPHRAHRFRHILSRHRRQPPMPAPPATPARAVSPDRSPTQVDTNTVAAFARPKIGHPSNHDALRVPSLDEYAYLLEHVRGRLVPFPLQFLCDADLLPSLLSPEGLAMEVFK